MKRVLVTCPPMIGLLDSCTDFSHELGLQLFAPNFEQTMKELDLINLVGDFDGWIIGDDPATEAVFSSGRRGRLRAAVKWGIGTDNVDFEACERLKIPVENTPGMFGAEVADLAICYLIGLSRDAFFIDRSIRDGLWPKPAGISLPGKTVGIVGLGDIGSAIARRAQAHELNVIAWDPLCLKPLPGVELCERWPAGLELCDFLVFACALTESTRGMFSTAALRKVKTGVRIVNVSRGGLLDESVVLEGLRRGEIGAAAFDVFEVEPLSADHPFHDYEKLVFGSHNASNTVDAVVRTSEIALSKLAKFLDENDK